MGTSGNGNVIVVDGLTKRFDDVMAVNGLSLEIRAGEMFGFLGPNGAGKTTTISILCGLLAPTAGSATIAGFDIGREPARTKALIGVCPQEVAVYKFLTGMENLELFGSLHGMDRRLAKQRALDLVTQAGFADAARRRTKGYSGGMKRQLNLSVIFIVPMMMFGALLAVFNDMTRTIARFTPNFCVSDSLSIIFHQGRISDAAIWQNLGILAVMSLVAVVAGIQFFRKAGYR